MSCFNLKRVCPICGNNTGMILKKVMMHLPDESPLPCEYDIVCCNVCGFTYADMMADQNVFNRYYERFNIYSENEDIKLNDWVEFLHKEIQKLFIHKISMEANILDVGCGGGEFLNFLKSKGYNNLYGLDPSKESIDRLKKSGINGMQGNIFDRIPNKMYNKFDLVISMAVIEHIYDLNLYVEQLKKYMKKDGYLLIYAPAVEGFSQYIYPLANYFNHEHINYFSRISLENLFGNHQLKSLNNDPYVVVGESDSEKEIFLVELFYEDIKRKPIFDSISRACIEEYFSKINDSDKVIEDILKKKKKVIIWGCGSYAMQLIAKYSELFEAIEYFVDNNTMKQRTEIGGKKVFSPQMISNESDAIILICSMMNSKDIEKQLLSIQKDCEYYIL